MAHVMLPESRQGEGGPPGKFADTAVPALVAEILRLGADRRRLRATIAGGARMFAWADAAPVLDIGARNVAAVKHALRAAGIRLRAEDVGGAAGRSMRVAVADGAVTVRPVGGDTTAL
jgi:chemotaxis protein CheD